MSRWEPQVERCLLVTTGGSKTEFGLNFVTGGRGWPLAVLAKF
jgi:hypothetical protein